MGSFLNRHLPLLLAIVLLISLFRFVQDIWPSQSAVAKTVDLLRTLFWYVVAAATIGWVVVAVSLLHLHDRIPTFLRRPMLMDILDRLTKKDAIEDGLPAIEDAATFVDAESLAAALKQRVIGQDNVCDDIAAQIRRRLALARRGKPVGVFLLAGPPGTGKTHLAKVLASELERPLLHFDMTQFASGSHSLSQLLGMTKGYIGSDTYGKLTGGLRDTPAAVVLLDEIEKAHPDVLKAFLTAWNDGFISERSNGQAISTTAAIFVLTTNAATERLAELSIQNATDPDAMRSGAINALKEAKFAPEVLNRIDRIFVFRSLAGLDVARVTALEIEDMIHGYGLQVTAQGIDPKIILTLMARHRKMGATASSRDLVRSIEEQLADSLIEAKKCGYSTILLVQENDQRVVARGAATATDSGK